jgi:Tfp pilus assembly protein PilN
MKAVNLIPPERRGPRKPSFGPARRSTDIATPIGPYAVLVVLALAVVMAAGWALTGRQLDGRQAELANTEQAAQAAEAKVGSLAPYTAFAAVSRARVETLNGLIDGRFDWSHGLREVARIVPSDVDLLSLVGTTSPTSSVQGAGGSGSLRGALPVPAIDLIGCARSQTRVAELLARLRSIDGVQRVSLGSSEKSDSASLNEGDCRANVQMPEFQITVFFQAPAGIVPAADATTAATVSGTSATDTSGGAK